MRVNYAIAFVSSMERLVAFYRDVLGMPLRFESAGWSEFTTEGATLALHLAESRTTGQRKRPTLPSPGRAFLPS